MVPAASRRISRAPRYSGSHYYLLDFTYRALTFFGRPSQTVLLSIRFDLVVLQPRRLTTPVWALPVSLATTQGIISIFFSSGYLDVSVLRVGSLSSNTPSVY